MAILDSLTDKIDRARAETPTYVLANALNSVLDLLPARLRCGSPVEIVCGVQLNGPPHLGTALTILLAIALAQRARACGAFQASVLLELLDNAPGGQVRRDSTGAPYRNPLFNLATADEVARIFAEYYGPILEMAAAEAVPLKVRRHSEYQASAGFRRALIWTLGHAAELGACLNPVSGRLPIRFPCPICGLVDVHAKHVEFRNVTHDAAEFSARCIDHGSFPVRLAEDEPPTVDLNSLYRNVAKDADRFLSGNAPAISMKGLDWIHGAQSVGQALALLGVPEDQRPFRLFTPIVADRHGAKLSKSRNLNPRCLLAPPHLKPSHQRERVGALFALATATIDHPPLFFRGYSIDALLQLLGEREALP
jgi:hypothetical protein